MRAGDDRALLERAQSSAAGFGELFDANYDRIYAYAYRRVGSRAIAEDIAASVFEDALKNIQRVRWQGKPMIAWLYRIASRRVADHHRSKRGDTPLDDLTIVDSHSIDESVERAEEIAIVRRGIRQLNEREREIIRLAYFDDLNGEAIASMLGCSSNSVYVRLHRALKKLERIVSNEIN